MSTQKKALWRVTVEVEFVMASTTKPEGFEALECAREEIANGTGEVRASEIRRVEDIPWDWQGTDPASTPLVWGANAGEEWTAEGLLQARRTPTDSGVQQP